MLGSSCACNMPFFSLSLNNKIGDSGKKTSPRLSLRHDTERRRHGSRDARTNQYGGGLRDAGNSLRIHKRRRRRVKLSQTFLQHRVSFFIFRIMYFIAYLPRSILARREIGSHTHNEKRERKVQTQYKQQHMNRICFVFFCNILSSTTGSYAGS